MSLNLIVGYRGARIIQGFLDPCSKPGIMFGCIPGYRKREGAFVCSSGQEDANCIRDGNA